MGLPEYDKNLTGPSGTVTDGGFVVMEELSESDFAELYATSERAIFSGALHAAPSVERPSKNWSADGGEPDISEEEIFAWASR